MFRFAVNIGFLERPLAGGLIWAICSGQWDPGLQIAVFFELFWLDLIPVGTFIPPQALFSTILTAVAVHILDLHNVGDICVIMVLSMPFAALFGKLESLQRNRQNQGHTELLRWARGREAILDVPTLLVRSSLTQLFLMGAVSFLVAGCLVLFLGNLLLQFHFFPSSLSWAHLWIFASLGGVLSLRVRRIYILFGVSLTLVLLLLLLFR